MMIDYAEKVPELKQYSVIVSTLSYESSRDIANSARKQGIKFIYTETKGVSGIYFADLIEHQVNDNNGEEPFEGIIKSITNEE